MIRIALLALCSIALTGCLSLESARESAANQVCEYQDRCDQIGAGKGYANRSECMTQERANWMDAWPTSQCEKTLDVEKLDLCLKAWQATACGNLLDTLSTYGKCSASEVCSKQ
jgi:hypothetical protein